MYQDNKPLISAVMPVYNSAPYIWEAVMSVLNQTERNFELLVMDDCSTDNTVELIESIQDKRIRIVNSEVNLGQSNQLNKGIGQAVGKYVAIVHGDDINLPDRFEKQVSALNGNPDLALVGSWVEYIGDRKGVWKTPETTEECFAGLIRQTVVAHPTVMFERSRIVNTGELYRQEFVPAEDYDLWVRLIPFCRFGNVPSVLLQYRIHDKQISAQKESHIHDILSRIRVNIINYYLAKADKEIIQFIQQLWHFKAGSRIDLNMIKNISRLSDELDGKGGVKSKIWNRVISQWVYECLLITKNYQMGTGFYFLFAKPGFLFSKKISNLFRIGIRSMNI
jgi:glycosyltransferase involved in cell wall biosynthesis